MSYGGFVDWIMNIMFAVSLIQALIICDLWKDWCSFPRLCSVQISQSRPLLNSQFSSDICGGKFTVKWQIIPPIIYKTWNKISLIQKLFL